jgi:hypothetical protein
VPEVLPSYDELPVRDGAPAGASWGVWDDDRLGCLNLLTPERARRGLACATRGVVFPLDIDLALVDPPLFGRRAPVHEVLPRTPLSSDDQVLLNTQSATQWDGFRHERSPAHGAYGGLPEEEHGIHLWAQRGIVGRAVLADVARHRPVDPSASDPITVEDLRATLAAQHVQLEVGDILLVRTGWLAWYRRLDASSRAELPSGLRAPGLARGEDMARFLWDLHIAAVAADNPALEVYPMARPAGGPDGHPELAHPAPSAAASLHWHLLPLLGLPLGELFDLDALALDCAAEGTWDLLFTSAPLHLRNGVASPPNALGIR